MEEIPRDHRAGAGVRLLLAEDGGALRGALAVRLELTAGFSVVAQVGRGDEVARTALEVRPDIALLDVELPGRGGLDAAAELRDEVPECRVVLLTRSARPGYLPRALAAGAAGLLVKDGPVEELAVAVRRVLTGETVIDPVLAAAARDAVPCPLSARERDVLAAAADGRSATAVAVGLGLPEPEVRAVLAAAVARTAARTPADAFRTARDHGWL
ncbi:response regulator [Streptomyces clavuligerus]|uniref:response regulator n=1 Tax=Streptomyces clavuligerus TaxID=1901 RepID=UPI000180026F|nr:response regulator [Streptomyces clavuligerus]ANW20419.1 two-component system response regulator [Streptomyces clavuligerus]EDY51645.1 two-component system response regulator [Streptomyces clavuligerus]MBY6305099.1 response regulator [Streptomyces clavuligerus]QPL65049.1 response regulator [Streptomyces clavuligerus]QPL71080.1 response regulator [Streptomyces clavuligerus]